MAIIIYCSVAKIVVALSIIVVPFGTNHGLLYIFMVPTAFISKNIIHVVRVRPDNVDNK